MQLMSIFKGYIMLTLAACLPLPSGKTSACKMVIASGSRAAKERVSNAVHHSGRAFCLLFKLPLKSMVLEPV